MKLKFSFIDKKQEIESFLLYKGGLYYCSENNLYRNYELISGDIESQSFKVKDDIIFFHNNDGEYILNVDNEDKLINFSPYFFTLRDNILFGSYDYSYRNGKFEWEIGKFNLDSFCKSI